MKNCFGYVRVSTRKQGEGVSLEAQKDAIERFAATNGITITNWYEEQQTAAKTRRPVFNAMLKALKAGRADGLIMHRIDRSARNFFDWARIGELADNGIAVHFATESLDFQSRGGRLAANIQMAVAEDYVRNLKAEIHKGQRGQLERGYYPFKAPIGYLDNGKNQLKTLDPERAPLVKRAFELYASGQYSLHSLRAELNRRGLRTAKGAPLSKTCIEKFLKNPFYTGIICIRRTGETYQGAHEPLISAQLFQRVAEVKAGKSGKKLTRHNHLFRGLFRCADCQRAMIPEKQKGYVYYRCQSPACRGNCVREEPLDQKIAAMLQTVRFPSRIIAAIEERVTERHLRPARSDTLLTLKRQLPELDERMDKLEDAAIDQIIDAANFNQRKRRLLLERKALEEEIRKAEESRTRPETLRRFLERLKSLAAHYETAPPDEKREIVEIATSNRSVASKCVAVEPSDWLLTTRECVADLSCAQQQPTSRNIPEYSDRETRCVERLAAAAKSPEAQRVFELLVDGYRRAASGTVNRPPNDISL